MTLYELLRHQTHALHQSLHVHPLLAPLQDDAITLNDYFWCIHAFHQAYLRMAQKPYAMPPVLDVPALDWLMADMHTHGLKPITIQIAEYPGVHNDSTYMGYLYVRQEQPWEGALFQSIYRKPWDWWRAEPIASSPDTAMLLARAGRRFCSMWKRPE